jgi:predicted 3-demethylubiquinone-9 3-methyltransferase (glyoxalase superfamily)
MSRITPCLWFDRNAHEAVTFYASVFEDSEIVDTTYYGEGSPLPAGTELMIRFRLRGEEFLALNGGPYFTFNEAVSFVIRCENQQEVDHYWDGLLAGGGCTQQCGWLKDRFGLSWQVVPSQLQRLLNDPDSTKRQRVMEAFMQMVKIDLAVLEAAAGS